MNKNIDAIIERCSKAAGRTGLGFVDLTTRESAFYNETDPMIAASVIKLFVMVEAFRRIENGLSPETEFTVMKKDKVPSCGAVYYMHEGLKVTFLDLITLMIIHSDNTCTNMLIDYLGMDNINRSTEALGINDCRVNRKLFDSEASKRGIQNYITAKGVTRLYEMLYDGKVISKEASEKMLGILKNQRLNGKMPFFLDCKVAHKTGEDDGITHDTGIVYSDKPFILVMLSNETDVPKFERLIQDAAGMLAGIDVNI